MKTATTASGRSEKTRRLVYLALLSAVILVLQFTPLGYIPIPGFNATTMHIPVILGAVLFGPAAGAFLGLVFGVTSMIQATLQVPLTAFLFSPFVPLGSYKSVIIAILPRVLVGLSAAYVYRFLARFGKSALAAAAVASAVGSLVNTVLVLGGAYVMFRDITAEKFGVASSALLGALLSVVSTNGIAEMIAAAVIVTLVVKALSFSTHLIKRRGTR